MCKEKITKSSVEKEYRRAKALGFKSTYAKAKERNPYLPLVGGGCLVWLAGGNIMLTDTAVHFGPKKLYLRRWSSDHMNSPYATVVSKQVVYENGKLVERNENYYRVAASEMIEAVAKWRGVPVSDVELDHINRKRGDNRSCNLRPADASQNSWNKGPDKVERAFYTEEEVIAKFASGEWVPEEV